MNRIFLCILIVLTYNVSPTFSQDTNEESCDLNLILVSLRADNQPVKEILKEIQKQTRYSILIEEPGILNQNRSISLRNTPLDQSLNRLTGVSSYSTICNSHDKTLTLQFFGSPKLAQANSGSTQEVNEPRDYNSDGFSKNTGSRSSLSNLTGSEKEEMAALYDLIEQENDYAAPPREASSNDVSNDFSAPAPSYSNLPPEEKQEMEDLYQLLQEEKTYRNTPQAFTRDSPPPNTYSSSINENLTDEEKLEMESLYQLVEEGKKVLTSDNYTNGY